jgi:spore coat polysaccharide biosynthesis predicted glycosyltransferase SpsG/2-C-methyl-D-erythritol 4-phosphate cytidylyltransferase
MQDGLRAIAIVPARGGTDSVPYLNLKRLGDRPLLVHTLEAGLAAKSIDRVVVSTDDAQIAELARSTGADVPFLRPTELARDIPSLKPVISHAVREIEAAGDRPDIIVALQPTSPFRDAAAIDEAIERLIADDLDTVISVTEDRTLNWRAEGNRLVPLFAREGRRADQTPIFKENGAIVAMRRAVIDLPARFGERVGYLILDKRAALTVHDLEDFWMAERLLRQPRILFRTDGSTRIGMGHVFRTLAIADALRATSQAELLFLMSADHKEGILEVTRRGHAVKVAADGRQSSYLDHIRDFAPAILINDLQVVDDTYLKMLAHIGATTVNLVDTLDDLEITEHYKQVIVSVMDEERETPEGFYGGPEYAILRSHFHGRVKEVRPQPRLILLTFGGSDPQGLTLKAARALVALPGEIEIVAVAGPAFSYRAEFERLAARLPRQIPLINEAGGHIADLMLEADVVLGSGGMSVYEIAALGTPGIIMAQNAKEDRRMREFARHGTVEYLGFGTEVDEAALFAAARALLYDAPRRQAMSGRGRALVDGLGARRAAELVLGSAQQSKEAAS